MTAIENTIVSIHADVAKQIAPKVAERWNVEVKEDGVGSYISITNPAKAEDERGIALAHDENGDDLTAYRWQFWNQQEDVFLESELDSDAEVEEVLDFLNDSLSMENRLTDALV